MTSRTPRITVIMAEYNTPLDYLQKAIESILNQTFKDFEFIIVNDGSKNNLEKIIKKYKDNRIRILNNECNKGFVYSLNKAIRVARGKYLVRMDTDDFVPINRIDVLHKFISKHPEYDVVSSKALEFTDTKKIGTIGKPGEKCIKDIMRGDIPVHAASIMLKSALVDIGGYKNKFPRAEDLALWCDLLLANRRLYVIDDVLYFYRVNLLDYNKRSLRHRGGEIRARLHYYPLMRAGPIEYFRIIKSIVSSILPSKVVIYIRNKYIVDKY